MRAGWAGLGWAGGSELFLFSLVRVPGAVPQLAVNAGPNSDKTTNIQCYAASLHQTGPDTGLAVGWQGRTGQDRTKKKGDRASLSWQARAREDDDIESVWRPPLQF